MLWSSQEEDNYWADEENSTISRLISTAVFCSDSPTTHHEWQDGGTKKIWCRYCNADGQYDFDGYPIFSNSRKK